MVHTTSREYRFIDWKRSFSLITLFFFSLHTSSAAAAAEGFLSFSGSIRTRTTPDLSTTSWISFPFLPITFPKEVKTSSVLICYNIFRFYYPQKALINSCYSANDHIASVEGSAYQLSSGELWWCLQRIPGNSWPCEQRPGPTTNTKA